MEDMNGDKNITYISLRIFLLCDRNSIHTNLSLKKREKEKKEVWGFLVHLIGKYRLRTFQTIPSGWFLSPSLSPVPHLLLSLTLTSASLSALILS